MMTMSGLLTTIREQIKEQLPEFREVFILYPEQDPPKIAGFPIACLMDGGDNIDEKKGQALYIFRVYVAVASQVLSSDTKDQLIGSEDIPGILLYSERLVSLLRNNTLEISEVCLVKYLGSREVIGDGNIMIKTLVFQYHAIQE